MRLRISYRLFHRLYHRTRLFFPDLSPELLKLDQFDDRLRTYQDMAAFPRHRATFIFTYSLVKVTPAFLYGFWVWGGGLITFHSNSRQTLDPRGLSLSTYPTLAWYQKTFNDMIERNVASEQEIHRWILRKAEDNRYLQLGQVTELFIHDLATPLTIMGLSLSQLEDQPSSQTVAHRYLECMRFCLQQISDFVGNLRLSIRDTA